MCMFGMYMQGYVFPKHISKNRVHVDLSFAAIYLRLRFSEAVSDERVCVRCILHRTARLCIAAKQQPTGDSQIFEFSVRHGSFHLTD